MRSNGMAISRPRNHSAGGVLNSIDRCTDALEGAGFTHAFAEIARAEWNLPDAEALVAALSAGTVRMAALLARKRRQRCPPSSPTSVREAEPFRRRRQLASPIAAILASGRKPAN